VRTWRSRRSRAVYHPMGRGCFKWRSATQRTMRKLRRQGR